MELSEYQFYKEQVQQAQNRGSNSIAVDVKFLNELLSNPKMLETVSQAYAALKKAM